MIQNVQAVRAVDQPGPADCLPVRGRAGQVRQQAVQPTTRGTGRQVHTPHQLPYQ